MARKRPTPSATLIIRTVFGIDGTCSASTCKSGSAIVTMMPKTKQISTGKMIFLLFPSCVPMPSPIGSIEMPEPIVNKLIPTISMSVPNKNITRTPEFIGASVMLNIKTIANIGSTDLSDSLTAPPSCLAKIPFFFICYVKPRYVKSNVNIDFHKPRQQ